MTASKEVDDLGCVLDARGGGLRASRASATASAR
jgi:hypothetical protein